MITHPIKDQALHYRFERGVNLIEIMVAMTIGLFLVLGATTLYINTKKTSDIDDTAARLQETARYAMSIIESDIRMANYWGLNSSSSNFVNKSTRTTIGASNSTNYCGADYATDVDKYIEASNTSYLSHNGSLLSCIPKDNTASSTSDSITIRRTIATDSSSSADSVSSACCSTTISLGLGADCSLVEALVEVDLAETLDILNITSYKKGYFLNSLIINFLFSLLLKQYLLHSLKVFIHSKIKCKWQNKNFRKQVSSVKQV